MKQDRYTLAYRAAEARQVMGWIEAGQSGCVIALRGGGKSNFLRFLLRQDVQQHYLGREHIDFAFVLVDLLALTECTAWAVYELILARLLRQLDSLGVEEGIVEEMTELYEDATHSRDPLTAQRTIERCVDTLCERSAQRIAFLFDEFDLVFGTLDPFLFRCLRAIRNAHKDQVSYIVVVADDLAGLRDDLTDVEHFYRMISRNVCGLGPYGKPDAQQMLRYLTSRQSIELSADDVACLLELSGGHASLLKTSLSLLWNRYLGDGLAGLASTLKNESIVHAECQKVWDGLSESERMALHALAGGAPVAPQLLRRLQFRGLAREGQAGAAIFSPLFADFVRRQEAPLPAGTVINRSSQMVQIGGRDIEELTGLEFEVLCYLYERRGRVCTKDELIENVYQQQLDRLAGGIDDTRLYTLISRLRDKIEPPRYIVTVHGEGYRFVEPE